MARGQLLHPGVNKGMAHRLNILLALDPLVIARSKLIGWATSAGAVDAKKIILNVYHIALGDTNSRTTYKTYAVEASGAVLILNWVKSVGHVTDILSKILFVVADISVKTVPTHCLLL